MRPYSLRRRLVLAMTAVMAAVFAGIGVFLYLGVRDAAWQQHDDTLFARARAIGAIAEHDEDGYEMELPPEPRGPQASYVEVWRPDGTALAMSPSLQQSLGYRAVTANPTFFDLTLPDGRPGRAVVLAFTPRDESGDAGRLTLLLAAGIEDVDRAIATVRQWFIALGLIALAVIAALVWWVVGRGLAPLERLSHAIEKIDDTTLATRLPLSGQPSELVAPIDKLNALLGRLETSFARERQFTADVSHELRTPLAGLRTLLEVTGRAERSTTEYQSALTDAHAVVLQLGALVENLLMLARLDAGQLAVTNREVALRELVDECWQPHAALAASRSLTFKNLVTGTTLQIDREKLRLVVGNLLANAAEYTQAGGWVEVTSTPQVPLAVADSGPPLPDEHKPFDRLWRGDAARAGTGVHCGIGLSLARSLCTAMSLSLTAENRKDGTVRFACVR